MFWGHTEQTRYLATCVTLQHKITWEPLSNLTLLLNTHVYQRWNQALLLLCDVILAVKWWSRERVKFNVYTKYTGIRKEQKIFLLSSKIVKKLLGMTKITF